MHSGWTDTDQFCIHRSEGLICIQWAIWWLHVQLTTLHRDSITTLTPSSVQWAIWWLYTFLEVANTNSVQWVIWWLHTLLCIAFSNYSKSWHLTINLPSYTIPPTLYLLPHHSTSLSQKTIILWPLLPLNPSTTLPLLCQTSNLLLKPQTSSSSLKPPPQASNLLLKPWTSLLLLLKPQPSKPQELAPDC
jgi:hypothetical protein